MISLVDYLCRKYSFSVLQLEKFLSNEPETAVDDLEGVHLYTNHAERRDPLMFDSISHRSVKDVTVNTGSVDCSLYQYVYIKAGIVLKYPDLPCFVQKIGILGIDNYYPIEMCVVDGSE